MIRFLLILPIVLAASAGDAQTNLILSNAPDSAVTDGLTNAEPLQVPAEEAPADASSMNGISTDKVDIFSDHLVITNIAARTPIYRGNVRVIHPQMYLTCEQLIATVPEEGRINYIVAETNVVVFATNKSDVIEARADRLTYTYKASDLVTNEFIVLTGNAWFKQGDLIQTGYNITYDVINEGVVVDRPRTTLTVTMPARTNAPSVPSPSGDGGSPTNAP